MMRLALLVDVERCDGCSGCIVGCKNWHGLPAGEPGRVRLVDETVGTFPDVARWVFPVMCMQCENPPCVAVCRLDACFVNEAGIVLVDEDKCVGCELCTFACPYGARVMRKDGKVADSCNLCLDRIKAGEEPYCVATCPTKALIFGDLDDPESEISRMIKQKNARPLKQKYGTRPKVLYTRAEEIEKFF